MQPVWVQRSLAQKEGRMSKKDQRFLEFKAKVQAFYQCTQVSGVWKASVHPGNT